MKPCGARNRDFFIYLFTFLFLNEPVSSMIPLFFSHIIFILFCLKTLREKKYKQQKGAFFIFCMKGIIIEIQA